jgi:CubicO group peptidase (beta-lactamase class C family)
VLDGAPDAACRDALSRWGAPGAVVGVFADDAAETRAYGAADLDSGRPVEAADRFRVASITKPATATLAVLLADEGLLALDEPVPLDLPHDRVAIAHLLSHTGGFEGEAGDLARFGDGDDALDAAVAALPGQRRLLPPGEAWSYSNAGYWAAGLLCARAAGTTYERALAERVLEPLGMADTSFDEPDVSGHVQVEPGDPRHVPAPPVPYPRARRPSGGLVSTADDLLRFAAHHLGEPRLARMREPLAETPTGAYGLGWQLERVEGVDLWSHLGSYGGFQTILGLLPERGAAFTVLTNGTGGDVVVREVTNALLGELAGVRRTPPPTLELGAAELAQVAGRYAHSYLDATVDVVDGRIALDVATLDWDGNRAPMPRLEARPVGRRTFAIVGGQWDGDRLDFVPREGRAEFARIGSVLVPRC